MIPTTKFRVSWPFCSFDTKGKIDFQDGCHAGHLRLFIGTILAIFDPQFPRYFLPSFESYCLSVQEMKGNIYSDFFFFLFFICKLPRCFIPSFESIGLSVQEKKRKIYFQDGGHLGFLIRKTLAIFYLQVTLMLPTKF